MSEPAISVLYATMSGNSMECALQTAKRLEAEGLAATATDLAYYEVAKITGESRVLVCISTWGDGEPPDDAVDFIEHLQSLDAGALAHLEFSVFALGDYNYDLFCQCGKDVDELFEKLGGQRLCPRVDADVDYEEEFNSWLEQVVAALRARALS